MTKSANPGEAVVERRLNREHEAIIARVDGAGLMAAYIDHTELWGVRPDGLGEVMMRQFLGAAALYLSSRPTDEQVAWTLNIAKPSMNLFVTGSTKENRVTGRVFSEDVKATERSQLYVDARRSQGEDRRSVIEVEGLDILGIFDQYAERSDQAAQRFFEITDESFLMVASLPTDRTTWIGSLDRESALAAFDAAAVLDERNFWFQCGCSKDKVLGSIKLVQGTSAEDLFEGAESLDVVCPRCGRRYAVTPADLDG